MKATDKALDLVGRIVEWIDRPSKPKKKVYCQGCGRDITFSGGYVTRHLDVYCISFEGETVEEFGSCLTSALRGGNYRDFSFASARGLQRAIRKGDLVYFREPEIEVDVDVNVAG